MAISPEEHKVAAATARSLMRMGYKPIKQSKKGGPTQTVQLPESGDPVESVELDESVELLKEEKPPEE